jgi:hypothetical protein
MLNNTVFQETLMFDPIVNPFPAGKSWFSDPRFRYKLFYMLSMYFVSIAEHMYAPYKFRFLIN